MDNVMLFGLQLRSAASTRHPHQRSSSSSEETLHFSQTPRAHWSNQNKLQPFLPVSLLCNNRSRCGQTGILLSQSEYFIFMHNKLGCVQAEVSAPDCAASCIILCVGMFQRADANTARTHANSTFKYELCIQEAARSTRRTHPGTDRFSRLRGWSFSGADIMSEVWRYLRSTLISSPSGFLKN